MDLNALYLRSRFWIKDYLNGSPIGKPYREIRYIQEHSYEEGLPVRTAALNAILDFACQHSAFYRSYAGCALKSFPVMNKMKLIEHYEEIRIPVEQIPGQVGDVHIQTTSGSTGTPFRIPQDTNKRLRRIAELKYFGKIAGFKTHDKLIHLRTWNKRQQKTAKQSKSENIIPFDIARMSDDDLKRLCELIISSKAVCLRGYASSLGKLSEYANGKGYSFPHLKLAIAGAEALHDNDRALFKKVMGADIQSQYANEECGIMAQERVPTQPMDNRMYWNNAGYFFEVLKFDSDEPAEYGELGRIVIPDLYNYAFPVIRYDNGDTAFQLPPDQYCNGYPVLGKLYGRRFDLTYATNGAAIFSLTSGRILKHYEGIAQWQFVQSDRNAYTLRVILRDNDMDLSAVVDQLKEYLGQDSFVSVEKVDAIPELASRKRKPVVNEWKKI